MEAVASQPPVAPRGSVDVTPVAGGTSMTALPSAMKEFARFFLNLSGSSSLGASGDSVGLTASAAALGGLACPSLSAAGAATFCGAAATPAGAGVLPDASAAVPGVSGEQQRRVRSRSRGRRSRSSDDRTDRRAKKRSRRRSPSPERSSRRREKRYRSSSDSSEDERADASFSSRQTCTWRCAYWWIHLGLWPSAVICKGGSRPVWGASSPRLGLQAWLTTTAPLPSSR